MSGPPSNRGLNLRALSLLFNVIAERKGEFRDQVPITLFKASGPAALRTIVDIVEKSLQGSSLQGSCLQGSCSQGSS